MKKYAVLALCGLALTLAGLSVLLLQVRNQRTSVVAAPPVSTAQQQAGKLPVAEQPQGYISGEPVRLAVPSVGINIAVIPGYYNSDTQEWTLTLNNAQYAAMTPEANNLTGNTFIYGHARSNVFGSLHKVRSGAEAVVTTDNGHTFYYRLNSIKVVSPDDTADALGTSKQPILTLQTCTGLLYQNRQLFSFALERAV